MNFKSSPWNGPNRHLPPSPRRQFVSQSASRPDEFSRAIKARYVLDADGTLREVTRPPDPVPPPAPPTPMWAPTPLPPIGWTVPDRPTPELVAGPIVAWRIWRISNKGVLMSYSHGDEWRGGVPMRGDPTWDNSAGIYALKTHGDIDPSVRAAYNNEYVIGTVALWGRVIQHKRGYRAEFAYPLEIDLRDAPTMPNFPTPREGRSRRGGLAARIEARYGCRVLTGPRSNDLTERQSTRD